MSKPIDAVAVENISKILGEYTTGPKITKMFSLLGFFDYDLQRQTDNQWFKASTKWRRLDETIRHECNASHNSRPFFRATSTLLDLKTLFQSQKNGAAYDMR